MFKSSSPFDKALDKATSQLLLEPDWDSILSICDYIRGGDTKAKYAVEQIKKKISNDNPRCALYALQVLESVMKNCGSQVHVEVATKEFMEYVKELVKFNPEPVKGKILELIQVWSHAFRNDTQYKIIQDTYNLMKMEGYQFPVLKEADAMFSAETAPEWHDGDNCHRCRTDFGTFTRKHHCRNCGQVFCNKCSSKNSIIPKFGIEKEVRVCDACFDSINSSSSSAPGKPDGDQLPAEYLASPLSKQSQAPTTKSEAELREEEELQLALALSQSEAESKEKERHRLRNNINYGYAGSSQPERSSSPRQQPESNVQKVSVPSFDTSDMDPELARYLNRNYWEQKQTETKSVANNAVVATAPSAPVVSTAEPITTMAKAQEIVQQNGENSQDEEQFLHALRSSLEIFVNRMKSNSQRGRSIANDTSVQTLFMTINAMHPQLMKYMGEQEDKRTYYESLQDKLAQLKDAREALDALRDDHREKKRREAEEQERLRQIQMAQKLEIMRQKKQEYLEYQRQLAMQRLQEQEREMLMRQEQIKQMTQMRQMQQYGYPQPQQIYGAPVQGFSPAGSVEGSPLHHAQQAGIYGQQPTMGQLGGPPMGQPVALPMGQPVSQPPGQPTMGALPPGAPVQQYLPASQTGYGGIPPQQPPVGGYQPPTSNYQQMPPCGPQNFQTPATQAPSSNTNFQSQGPAPVQQNFPPQTQPPVSQVPPGGQPAFQPTPGYVAQPGSLEYQSFNMQNVQNALPPQGQQPPYTQQMPPQQYMGPPQGQPYGSPPPQQQQQQQSEAQLISFD